MRINEFEICLFFWHRTTKKAAARRIQKFQIVVFSFGNCGLAFPREGGTLRKNN